MGKRVNHGFPPFIPEDARVLILGSFPSVRSRASGFFYMHPQNRFFKALALVYGEREPLTIGERKDFLIRHRIALYDVIESCSISGSADGSIKDAVPADIPGMVVVQHMPVGFTKMYAERLDKICKMEVREAVNGDEIRPGLVLIAPADLQVKVVRMGERYTLSCFPGEKVSGHRPSVDALFSSMASTVKCHMVGIIMTGMGRDGASGLLAMRKAGAYTIGQDRESSVVYGMPMVAHDIGAVKIQASCENIASVLMTHLKTGK